MFTEPNVHIKQLYIQLNNKMQVKCPHAYDLKIGKVIIHSIQTVYEIDGLFFF